MVARATLDVAFEILEENKGPLSFLTYGQRLLRLKGMMREKDITTFLGFTLICHWMGALLI